MSGARGDGPPESTARNSGSWIERIFDLLSSGLVAIILLTVLVLLCLLYLFIPQWRGPWEESLRQWVEERGTLGWILNALQLTTIRSSWLLRIDYTLLFVNLFFCMIRRLRTGLLMARAPSRVPAVTPRWLRRDLASTGIGIAEVAFVLSRRGYRTTVFQEGIYGLRGRFAVLGSWLFHVGILALMASAGIAALQPEPFRGIVGVGEEESFDIHATRFLGTNAPVTPELPGLAFQVTGVRAVAEDLAVREYEVRLATAEGTESSLGINRPFRKPPYQVLASGFGYMPGWVIADARGRMVRGAWIKGTPFPLEPAEERFAIGPRTSNVTFRFFPDYALEAGREITRTYDLRNPRFVATVRLRGKMIFDGVLKPGQRIPLEEGRVFFFLEEIRRYALLDVIQEREQKAVFASFGIMILGLFIRYGRIRKEVAIRVSGDGLELRGQSEILEHLFAEEMDRLAAALAGAGQPLAAQEATP